LGSRSSRRISLIHLLAIALGVALASIAAFAESAPPDPAQATKVVEDLHAVMLGVMKDANSLGFDGRLAKLQPAIAARYDFPFIAEKSVGLVWKDFDDAQRTKLVDAMARLAGATYAARMDSFSGERFVTLGTEPAGQSTLIVRTQIVEGTGKKTSIDYRMRNTDDGQPRIVDVFYDGTVSELAMRRSEYSALLKKGGLPELLDALEKKIAEQRMAKPS
jgi:phospholipid transport system substrate-binding protein